MRYHLLSILLMTCALSPTADAQFFGVPGCESPPCQNVVPCAHCSGTWADNYTAQWQITSDLSNNISGTVSVPGSSFGTGCPNTTWQVSGTLTRSFGLVNYAEVVMTGSNPNQPSTQNCLVFSSMTYTGRIGNNSCDRMQGTWTNSNAQSGSFVATKPAELPEGNPTETTSASGWGTVTPQRTVHQWRGTIQSARNFAGRQVTELQGFGNVDTCWWSASFLPPSNLTGGGWNVGYYWDNNIWADDYVGLFEDRVVYYRQNFRPPCQTSVSQNMGMYVNGTTNQQQVYKSHSVGYELPNYQHVISKRDGQTSQTTWP